MNNTFCIVVTFNPDLDHLTKFIEKLDQQFNKVIIVDNSSKDKFFVESLEKKSSKIKFFLNDDNLGIGKAQNIGIHWALNQNASHIAVFDQDSLIQDDYLESLLKEEENLKRLGKQIAAIGPILVDEATGNRIPFFQYGKFKKRRVFLTKENTTVECFSLLSSGTLMNRKAVLEVGFYNEELFLEYVDIEWGARARDLGFLSYGTSATTLTHNLGDERLHLFSIVIPLHSPLRHYYTMRNGIYMQKMKFVPFSWKLNDAIRLIRSFILFSIFNPPRLKQVYFMLKGLIHGCKNKMGKYKS
ncbi:glycosyltransferase family 2 protein [Comamonas sp. A7-5]|uniref:glycosyltransferase family 2 protein n=1 Tax=Comamonas sp. A7-5 TaxID=673549 RepID=UPI0031D468D9